MCILTVFSNIFEKKDKTFSGLSEYVDERKKISLTEMVYMCVCVFDVLNFNLY